MRIHILGICGTFMGGIALLARELGHEVSGSDQNTYPPMSTLLQDKGISLYDGYDPSALPGGLDVIIIGNALSRGNPVVEHVLNERLPYVSGPEWLASQLLAHKHVFAISGTHGKTSTTSMLAWVLDFAGLAPGFLIGGVAENFGISARCGASDYFVVEADEYDTAFFDKRPKFIHYHPRTLVINNIEFDHADIFGDIGDIIREFQRLVRIVPEKGQIVYKHDDPNIASVLQGGSWSRRVSIAATGAQWWHRALEADYSVFEVYYQDHVVATVKWDLIGQHNADNALAVMAAATEAGVEPVRVAEALGHYKSVKRRLQALGTIAGISVFDDFAHHPTAIRTTLSGLRARVGGGRIIAVFEPRSNTMKLGVHRDMLLPAFADADMVWSLAPAGLDWDLKSALEDGGRTRFVHDQLERLLDHLVSQLRAGDNVVIMSNGGFGGLQQKLLTRLQQGVA